MSTKVSTRLSTSRPPRSDQAPPLIAETPPDLPRRSRWRSRRRDLLALIGRRLSAAIVLLIAVSAGVFMLASRSPFDPLVSYLGVRYQQTTQAHRDSMTSELGFNDSWWQSWWVWAGDLLQGDLGWSRVYSAPVTTVFAERIGWTLLLSAGALLLALVLAIALGTTAGLRPGSLFDRLVTGFAVTVQAAPPFVLALGAVAAFAVTLRWAPAGGVSSPGQAPDLASVASHLVLPMSVLALTQLPWLLLAVRSSIARADASDPVRGARTRGIPPTQVVTGHIMPVSLASLVTLVGARVPELIVGAVLVEEIFTWPGLAAAVVSSAIAMDFALLAALTVATTGAVLLGSLIADAAYLLLDPRVSPDV